MDKEAAHGGAAALRQSAPCPESSGEGWSGAGQAAGTPRASWS